MDALEDLQLDCQDCMDRILGHFKPGRKITVLVRSPDQPTADFCMTNDDLAAVAEMVERRRSLGHEGPPARNPNRGDGQ